MPMPVNAVTFSTISGCLGFPTTINFDRFIASRHRPMSAVGNGSSLQAVAVGAAVRPRRTRSHAATNSAVVPPFFNTAKHLTASAKSSILDDATTEKLWYSRRRCAVNFRNPPLPA